MLLSYEFFHVHLVLICCFSFDDSVQAEVAALARRLAKVNDLSGVSQKFGMLQQQPTGKQQQQLQQQNLEHAYKPRQFQ
jgi:hypothetical protein